MILLNAKQNKIYQITGISGESKQSRRLLDMGFTPGTGIYVVGVSPFGGTVLVSIRGSLVGLREDAASLIMIEESSEEFTACNSNISDTKTANAKGARNV